MDIEGFLELVRKRRSIRRFKPDPVSDEDVKKIIEAARWAMSGANGQPWEFVVVKDPETKTKIAELYQEFRQTGHKLEMTRLPELRHPGASVPPTQLPHFKDAPVIIVVCGDPRTLQATVMSAHFLFGEYHHFHANLANAVQIMHLAIAALGLGSQWVTVEPIWEASLKALLGIPEVFRIYMFTPLGHPAYEPPPSYRRELEEIVHWEMYDQSRFRSVDEVIEFIVRLRKLTTPAYRARYLSPG